MYEVTIYVVGCVYDVTFVVVVVIMDYLGLVLYNVVGLVLYNVVGCVYFSICGCCCYRYGLDGFLGGPFLGVGCVWR
jgi:hypothetical protein